MPKIMKKEEIWIDYPADPFDFDIDADYEKDEVGGKVLVPYLNEGEFQRLIGKTLETRTTLGKGGNPELIQNLDLARDSEETAIAYTKDWANFFDEDGKPLKCNPKNIKLFSAEEGYIAFLRKAIAKVKQITQDKRKDSEKN